MEVSVRDVELRFNPDAPPLLSIPALDVAAGDRVLVRGASGSGKSTLLHVLTGLQRPSRGTVRLDGVDLGSLGENQLCDLRAQRVGFVFQRLNILEHLTAVENVQLASPANAVSRGAARAALERVGMQLHENRPAWMLSLGEQQRVAVARVLATAPRLVVADEPTSSLDAENAERVLGALIEATGSGATLIVATHDERIVHRFRTTWTLQGGTVAA